MTYNDKLLKSYLNLWIIHFYHDCREFLSLPTCEKKEIKNILVSTQFIGLSGNNFNMESTLIPQNMQPKKEEWALINNQQALQYKKMKEFEKYNNREKRQRFRSQLDQQLNGKNDVAKNEREQDIKFSQYLKQKAEEMNQKEYQEKMNKLNLRRSIQEENQHRLEEIKTSSRVLRGQDNFPGLEIGRENKQLVKERNSRKRQDLVDTLDRQLTMKQEERKMQRYHDQKIIEANMNYQQLLDERNRKNRRYSQNQRVYNYYSSLNQERMEKQKDLEEKYILEASRKKKQEEMKRQEEKMKKKHFLNDEIKKTLDSQVRYHSELSMNSKKVNPEDNSYSMMKNVFREKKDAYDKREYSEYLRKQAEEQSYRKKKWNFMNEQEYRYNMNQLTKAVDGSYAHDKYIDRSVNVIGLNQSREIAKNDKNDDPDIYAVKHKIEEIHYGPTGNTMNMSMDVSGVNSRRNYEPPIKIN